MKLKLLFISTLLTSALAVSQTTPVEQTTPSKIKVYTPSSSATSTSSKDNSYKWAVKTDVFGIIAGEFPIIAEYRIADKFSVEGSAGITYGFYPNDFSITSSDEGGSNYEGKAALGSAFRAAIKYYPSSDYDAIEGWSFGIQLFSKTTNRDYDVTSGDGSILLDGKKDSKTKTGASLIIGKQIFQDSNITFESFIGIGFANRTREYYNVESVYDNNTGNSVNTLKSYETKDAVPNIQFGFRIGFGN